MNRVRVAIVRTLRRWSAALDLDQARRECKRLGHLWDADRPLGPIHERNICWRCDAVKEDL